VEQRLRMAPDSVETESTTFPDLMRRGTGVAP
jgi:hypothetical protein